MAHKIKKNVFFPQKNVHFFCTFSGRALFFFCEFLQRLAHKSFFLKKTKKVKKVICNNVFCQKKKKSQNLVQKSAFLGHFWPIFFRKKHCFCTFLHYFENLVHFWRKKMTSFFFILCAILCKNREKSEKLVLQKSKNRLLPFIFCYFFLKKREAR